MEKYTGAFLSILSIILLTYLTSKAQVNLEGKWTGQLRQHIMGSFTDSPYQLQINQLGDSLYGIAHIEASEFLSVYAEMAFTGRIKGNKVYITENKFLEGTDLNDAVGWCIKELTLTHIKSEKGYRLKGNWEGYANNNGKACKPGILYLDKLSANFTGYIQDSLSKKMLGAEVYVLNLTEKEKTAALETYQGEGIFNFYADTANWYQILVKAEGYHYKIHRFKPEQEGAVDTLLLSPLQGGDLLAFGNVRFMQSTPYLVKDSETILQRLKTFLKENKSINIEISGHTSNEGDPDKNKQLSLERAETIANFLIQEGIEANRITTLGFGEERPIASNASLSGRKRNRRVEFRVIIE